MTQTKQHRCAPSKEAIEISSSQCGKSCKTEAEKILDDLNSLYDSLCVLHLNLHRLDCWAQKQLTEQNKRKSAGFEAAPKSRLEGKPSAM